MSFRDLFATGDTRQDNFRSRLFGMFSEDVVRFWAKGDAPYRVLDGRPTIYDGTAYATIDFTLERRADGRVFIAEQKAELAWMKYAYLRLDNAAQVDHHRGRPPFDWFLEAAREPAKRLVKTAGKVTPIDGAILVWGAVSEQGRAAAIAELGLADVLSLEDMIADLRARQDPDWAAHVERLEGYTVGLLKALR